MGQRTFGWQALIVPGSPWRVQARPLSTRSGPSVLSIPICRCTGFYWDRNWQVTRPDGRFLTQRQIPKCACTLSAQYALHLWHPHRQNSHDC